MPGAKTKVGQPGQGLGGILSNQAGELRIGAVRGMVMTETAFSVLQQVINEQMPEFMIYGFYEMGYRAGLDIAAPDQRAADAPEEAFRGFIETYRQAGYGDIEVVAFNLSEPSARLRGNGLLEASVARRSGIYRSPRAICHYSRGMFAGLFSRILGAEVVCEELSCEYRNDPCCEFEVLSFGGQLTG